MMDRVAGTVPLVTPEPERWREQVHDLMRGFRDALEAYPGMASVLLGEPPTTENTLAGAENLLGILLAGGIASQDAAWAVDILMLIVTATATEADVRRAAGKTTDADRDERSPGSATPSPGFRPSASRSSSATPPSSSPAPATSGSASPSTPFWTASSPAPPGPDTRPRAGGRSWRVELGAAVDPDQADAPAVLVGEFPRRYGVTAGRQRSGRGG